MIALPLADTHSPPVRVMALHALAYCQRLCVRCSLAPACLPEEVRQERQPERDPVRLFPADRDPGIPEELQSQSRRRRPPQDRFNALLSFGYGLLHTAVMRGILAAGLE